MESRIENFADLVRDDCEECVKYMDIIGSAIADGVSCGGTINALIQSAIKLARHHDTMWELRYASVDFKREVK